MDFLTQNPAESLIVMGIALLCIEVLILGFSTFILFFVGLSLTLTGTAIWIGILPDSLMAIILSNAILTAILAVALWQPLKNLQSKTSKKAVKSDFDGHEFFSPSIIDQKSDCAYSLSGITWQLRSEKPIAANVKIIVVKAEVGILWVKAV